MGVSRARACRAAGVALLGGETAEMPGVYVDGELDVAGHPGGPVDRRRIIDGSAIRPGDAVLGLARAACTPTATAWPPLRRRPGPGGPPRPRLPAGRGPAGPPSLVSGRDHGSSGP
ncbi:MAG: hypothetical protein R3F43_12510 [bacterium]